MTWQGANLAFWLITILVVAAGALAAFARNLIQAAFALFFTLVGMAGYYVLLGSDFLAITQVVIYVGGILVLLIFGVLLTNRPLERPQGSPIRAVGIGGLVGAAIVAGVLWQIIRHAPWRTGPMPDVPPPATRALGRLLLTDYLLTFELAGMTLLLCLVGAAYLVRRKER